MRKRRDILSIAEKVHWELRVRGETSITTLCEATGSTRETIVKVLAHLKRLGLVRERRVPEVAPPFPTRFFLLPPHHGA